MNGHGARDLGRPGRDRRHAEAARLVVVEHGASEPDQIRAIFKQGRNLGVVVQHPGETPTSLVSRVRRRAQQLESAGANLTHAALIVEARAGEAVSVKRALLIRTLIAHLSETRSSELLLEAPSQAGTDLRHELLALVESVLRDLHSSIEVCVRFGRDPKLRKAWNDDAPSLAAAGESCPVIDSA